MVRNGIDLYKNVFHMAMVIHMGFHKKTLLNDRLYFCATRAFRGTISLLTLCMEDIEGHCDTYALLDGHIDGFWYIFRRREEVYLHIELVVLLFEPHKNMATRQKKH